MAVEETKSITITADLGQELLNFLTRKPHLYSEVNPLVQRLLVSANGQTAAPAKVPVVKK